MTHTITNDVLIGCWSKILSETGHDFFIEQFYQTLFSMYPETRQLFADDLTEQKRTLLATLDNVINGNKYVSELEGALLALGQHHKNIGVKEEMFDAFIHVVVETAKISSNNSLTSKELDTWKQAFHKISNIMLRAY